VNFGVVLHFSRWFLLSGCIISTWRQEARKEGARPRKWEADNDWEEVAVCLGSTAVFYGLLK
jgi:hypothetical protein